MTAATEDRVEQIAERITCLVTTDNSHGPRSGMRRAGVDTLTTMAISGRKSLAVFRRYNTIAPQDLRKAIQQLGTYMDTTSSQGHTSTR